MKKQIINQRTETKWTPYLATGVAEGFEPTESLDHQVEAWAYLIATRIAYSLQGWFGRNAQAFISEGLIDSKGAINWDEIDARRDEA